VGTRLNSISIRGLKDSPDTTYQLGPLAIFTGPMGCGKSAVLDAIRLLRTGQHIAGDVAIKKPGDIYAKFGRGDDIEIVGDFGAFQVTRAYRLKKNGDVSQTLKQNIREAKGVKENQAVLDDALGNPLVFEIMELLRGSEQTMREAVKTLMSSALSTDLDEIKERIGPLPTGIQSLSTDPGLWLGDVREFVNERKNDAQQRKLKLEHAITEQTSIAIGSPQIVQDRRAELKALQDEREEVAAKRGAIAQAENQRQQIIADIEATQAKVDRLEAKSDTTDADVAYTDAVQRKDMATGALVNRRDELAAAKRQMETLNEESAAATQRRSDALAHYNTLKATADAIASGVCPTCGAKHDSTQRDKAKADAGLAFRALEAANEEAAACADSCLKANELIRDLEARAGQAEADRDQAERDIRDHKAARDRIRTEREQIPVLKARIAELNKSLDGITTGDSNEDLDEILEGIEVQEQEAQARLDEALRALASAEERAKTEQRKIDTEEELATLKELLATIDQVRHEMAMETNDPIAEVMQGFLGTYGEFKILTETPSGRTCFRPGIVRNDLFRGLLQLSGGESKIGIPAYAVALVSQQRGAWCPALIDDFQDIDRTNSKDFLKRLLGLIRDEVIPQAFLTLNVHERTLPECITDAVETKVISFFGPRAAAEAV